MLLQSGHHGLLLQARALFARTLSRSFTAAAPQVDTASSTPKIATGRGPAGKVSRKGAVDVPNVLVEFGTGAKRLSFVSHPGVMAVAKLLEMRSLVTPRAVFTQGNVDAIREFDEELARKCQIALDNGLVINMMDVEHIDRPGYVDKLVKDKAALEAARKEVMSLPVGGPYTIPKSLENYQQPEVDPKWNPSNEVGPEVFEVQPGYRQEVELRGIVKSFLNREEKGYAAQRSIDARPS
eukprot:GHVQ01015709.1.p1 GENE.GHVQ01015709.1~~GHVQ01015709.1.p1  ORF type:complete len:238 (+),score=27.27 GHVQ01015709.1:55-768(+)